MVALGLTDRVVHSAAHTVAGHEAVVGSRAARGPPLAGRWHGARPVSKWRGRGDHRVTRHLRCAQGGLHRRSGHETDAGAIRYRSGA